MIYTVEGRIFAGWFLKDWIVDWFRRYGLRGLGEGERV